MIADRRLMVTNVSFFEVADECVQLYFYSLTFFSQLFRRVWRWVRALGVDFISQSYISLEIHALNTYLRMFVLIKNITLL